MGQLIHHVNYEDIDDKNSKEIERELASIERFIEGHAELKESRASSETPAWEMAAQRFTIPPILPKQTTLLETQLCFRVLPST